MLQYRRGLFDNLTCLRSVSVAMLCSTNRCQDVGVFLLRLGIGAMFLVHGWPKLVGGTAAWVQLGGAFPFDLGVTLMTAMGFLAAVSEFFGGLFLMMGFFTRTSSFFLMMTMVTAAGMHLRSGDPFTVYSHALSLAIVFLSMMFIGPGRYSVDRKNA